MARYDIANNGERAPSILLELAEIQHLAEDRQHQFRIAMAAQMLLNKARPQKKPMGRECRPVFECRDLHFPRQAGAVLSPEGGAPPCWKA